MIFATLTLKDKADDILYYSNNNQQIQWNQQWIDFSSKYFLCIQILTLIHCTTELHYHTKTIKKQWPAALVTWTFITMNMGNVVFSQSVPTYFLLHSLERQMCMRPRSDWQLHCEKPEAPHSTQCSHVYRHSRGANPWQENMQGTSAKKVELGSTSATI